jgi:tRNA A37 threonylcarbamoyladenosine dehydratase
MTSSAHPDWQERTIQLIGEKSKQKLNSSRVLIVGLGGVGAMAAEMLCRAGIGNLTIIDGDTVQAGNINRQLPARHSTIGQSKAGLLEKNLLDINPDLELSIVEEYVKDIRMETILDGSFDYVVDAIDTLSPKIYLIYHTMNRGLPLVSSMGSGGKMDPSQIEISDFSKSYNCKLAYLLRKKLRKLGVEQGFKVVFSTEQVSKEVIIPVDGERNKKSTVGTISYIPAIFGCLLASVVIRDLIREC